MSGYLKLVSFQKGKSALGFELVLKAENYLYCKLGKRRSISRNLSPRDHLRQEKSENWPFCHMLIDTSEDSQNGQKIAIEYKRSIFSNQLFPLRALADEINWELSHNGYILAINPISYEVKFWDLVKELSGKIEKVEFKYNSPNLFN